MKKIFGNSYVTTLRSNWNESLLALWTVQNVCFNVLSTLPTFYNELSDYMKRFFSMDYLIALRIVCNK